MIAAAVVLALSTPLEVAPSLLARDQPVSLPHESASLPRGRRTVLEVHADPRFRFVINGGGRTGQAPPTFVVCLAGTDECREILAVSTEHAVLGCYPCDQPLFAPGTPIISVTWDFRSYRSKRYAPIPLRTSGSFVFPDKVLYDEVRHLYEFYLSTSLPALYATTLQVRVSDLEHLFTVR